MSAPKAAEAPKEEKKKSGKGKLLLIVILALVLLGGGGGGFFWWKTRQAAEAAAAEAKDGEAAPAEHAEESLAALPFKPFVVNLAGSGSQYLKADIKLLVSGVEDVKELEEDEVVMLRLRSAILEHLSQQTADTLVTPEGKEALKKALAEQCTKILGHAKVSDVLFAEFVVQF